MRRGHFFLPVFDGLVAVVIYKLMMLGSSYRCSMNGEVRSVVLQSSQCKKVQFTTSFLDILAVKTSLSLIQAYV